MRRTGRVAPLRTSSSALQSVVMTSRSVVERITRLMVVLGLVGLSAAFLAVGPATAAGVTGQSAYRPVTPCRLTDSRDAAPGHTTVDASTIRIQVTGRCGITAGASAAAISIAVTGTAGPGFAAVTPAGTVGATSTINWSSGETRSASTVVKLSAAGAVDVLVSAGLDAADVIVDVTGQWDPVAGPVAAGRVVTIPARRVLDTRVTSSRLGAGRTLTLGRVTLGVPAGATAVTGTLTSTSGSGGGYLTGFAAGTPVPLASNVNTDGAGQDRSAGVILPLSANGLSVFAGVADTDVVLDITGYVTGSDAAASVTGLLVPVVPTRILDTRNSGATTVSTADAAVPAAANGLPLSGLVATLTATDSRSGGFASVVAVGQVTAPGATVTSSLNWAGTPGAVASMTVQSLTATRQLRISASSPTALILDVTGYLIGEPAAAPAAGTASSSGTTATTASTPSSTSPRPIATGVITDSTGTGKATGDPLALLRQTFTPAELRAGGGVSIVNAAVPNNAPAMVPYNAAAYPVCGSAPMCILVNEAHWTNPGQDPVNSNRVMISHEFGHVIAMRYQTYVPSAEYGAWFERYTMVNEECVADSIATLVLARGGFPPNQTSKYSVHYDCDAYWTEHYGADHLAEMRAMSIDVASNLLNWAGQWGAAHPA